MCIVIDTNTFASVFDPKSQKHPEFRPVFEWIIYGDGKIVFGGTKYREELRQAHKYLRFFVELVKVAKVVEVDIQQVDKKQREVARMINNPDFDDPHLVAIIIVSGCKLICSDDSRAYPFLKCRDLYPKNVDRPKIYRKATNITTRFRITTRF